jgi:hypothetical protein
MVKSHEKRNKQKWLWTCKKTIIPEDNTDPDVRKNKNFAAELTKAVKL